LTAKVTTLSVKPGIQRDGTQFAADGYVDGEWVRFQRGMPRKVGGYNGIFLNGSGISRGMTMTSTGGLNYVVSGYWAGVEGWSTDNDDGVGFGPTPYTITSAHSFHFSSGRVPSCCGANCSLVNLHHSSHVMFLGSYSVMDFLLNERLHLPQK